MNRKLVFLTAVSAMLVAPAVYLSAQDKPAPPDDEGGPAWNSDNSAPDKFAPPDAGDGQTAGGVSHDGSFPPEAEGVPDWQNSPRDAGGRGSLSEARRNLAMKRRMLEDKRGGNFGGGMNDRMGPGMDMNGEHGGGRPGMGPGFPPEKAVLSIIEKNDPQFSARLKGLKTTAPAKHRMALGLAGRLLAAAKMDESLEKDAVRELSLEYDTRELSRDYEKASDANKAKIKAELKGKVSELFDLRLKGQAARIQHMEKEVAKLKAKLEVRKTNKAKIVEQRVEELTGEGYGW